MAFYKKTAEGILCALNFVYAPGYSLTAEDLPNLALPIDGWYWFDTPDQMAVAFVDPPAIPTTAITRFALRSRFTSAERVAMEIASLDDPAAPMAARQAAAALRSSQADLQATKWVDFARPDTVAGIQMLEQYGIIAPGRAAEILSAPIEPYERP